MLLIDDAARRILFEGDRERYEIPFASVESVSLEEAPLIAEHVGIAAGTFAVVVGVRTAAGARELPLCVGLGLPGAKRRAVAAGLCAELGRRCGVATGVMF